MTWKTIGQLGQWLGLVALVVAITLLCVERAAVGAIVTTIASLLYALSTKARYYGARRKRRPRVSIDELLGYNRRVRDPLGYPSSFTS